MAVDWQAVEKAGIRGAMEAMNRGGQRITARAKELAPVRKVFEDQDDVYAIRLKTVREIRQDAPIRTKLGLGPENPYVHPPTIVSQRAPQELSRRTIARPGRLRLKSAQEALSYRGRYELRTMRSAHKGELGGRLRDEIYLREAELDGTVIRVKIISPTPYAKYQELGTRHNPAHPYLRPAGYESRDAIRSDVGRSVSAAAAPLIKGRYVVTARFVARGAAA